MPTVAGSPAAAARLRAARIGDRVPAELLGRPRARRIDATALFVPGREAVAGYRRRLEASTDDFAGWDGRAIVLPPDGERTHRLVIVDRYGQVYQVVETASVEELPSPAELDEWFKFLATMCPECGVLDDPIGRGWTP